jgi:hypothetical protein
MEGEVHFAKASDSQIATGYTDHNRDITFSAWYKGEDTWTDNGALFSMENGVQSYKTLWYGLEGDSGGNTYFRGYIGNGTSYDSISACQLPVAQATGWNHYAITISSETDNTYTANLYVNGELCISDTVNTYSYDSTARAVQVGDGGSYGYQETDGYIKDWRVYDRPLSQPEVAILASQMNAHGGISDLQVWYKLDGDDISGTGITNATGNVVYNGTVTGLTTTYDMFSIKLHPVATGTGTGAETDGDVTVTRGTLEGLSLSKMNFNGTNNEIDIGSVSGYEAITMSIWVFPHDANPCGQAIFAGSGSQSGIATGSCTSDILRVKHETLVGGSYTDTAYTWQQDTWQHVAFAWDQDTGILRVYVDGVLVNTTTGLTSGTYDMSNLTIGSYGGQSWPFDGELRDARLFDYALSGEQIAAVYADSYPVTPQHMWKLDQGTWVAWNIYDTGWDTALNGNADGATYQNPVIEIGKE